MDSFRPTHISRTGRNLPRELFRGCTSELQQPHYEVINIIPTWVISWNTYPAHGKTLQQPQPNQIEEKKQCAHTHTHISSNNQQAKLFLSRRKRLNARIPSGFIMSVYFRLFLHFIASKHECLCLWQCFLSPKPFPTALVRKTHPMVSFDFSFITSLHAEGWNAIF